MRGPAAAKARYPRCELVLIVPHHSYNRFTALFPGPPGWAGARRKLLLDFMVLGRMTRITTDNPGGCHSIWISQQSTYISLPIFYAVCPSCRNPPNLSWLGTDTGICWIAYPVSASVNLPLHHKVQGFFSGAGSSEWSRKKAHKTVVVCCGAYRVVCTNNSALGIVWCSKLTASSGGKELAIMALFSDWTFVAIFAVACCVYL